ncbi:PepSY domain-containing protein [Roseibium marinum]|uniref:YpeB-like protein with putative protease inhibitory function n=1 Tax=Roseibium marinum TaxID=281252 RepID=A0A2S3UUP2_9HYPH|nr:PepSY domain-containing protein [Roseibium marinum]POF31442.1 YpeB-like protein with putative protease inhibitory function [Roseibium marinum]
MKTSIMAMAAALAFSTGVYAAGEAEVSAETEAAIMAKLTEMECQMSPDDIEVTEDGYELDDVICKGGKQFDIELDAELNETGRRAE